MPNPLVRSTLYRLREEEVTQPLWILRESTPEERVACAVIMQAIKDCCKSTCTDIPSRGRSGRSLLHEEDGTSVTRSIHTYRDVGKIGRSASVARDFLSTPNFMLSYWCGILSIHPEDVNEAYRKIDMRGGD